MSTLALKNENKKTADKHPLPHLSGFGRVLPGLALTGVITALALWLSDIPALSHLGLSALTLAIVIGMVVGNTVYPAAKPWCEDGVTLAKQRLLRLGIILSLIHISEPTRPY